MTWTLDKGRKVWIASSYSDLDGGAINNLAEYGEPYSPYQHPGWIESFDPDFANVVVEMTQIEVMTNGYGRNITARDFPIITRFLSNTPPFSFGSYKFDNLVALKYAAPSDRWISSNLYGWGPYSISAGDLPWEDAAYVHGSVAFALMKSSTFIYSQFSRRVSAEIGAGDDNWDFNSATIPDTMNAAVAIILGPDHYNLDGPIKIQFIGPGKRSVVERMQSSGK